MKTMQQIFSGDTKCPVWIKSLDGTIVYVNGAFEELYDMTSKDVVGQKNIQLFDGEKSSIHDGIVVETKEKVVFEQFVHGMSKFCYIAPFINEDNNVVGYAGIMLDTNELIEGEVEFQAIIDSISDVIFYKNQESQYIAFNKVCKDFYENRGIYNLVGKTDLEINDNKQMAESFMAKDKVLMETKEMEYTEARFMVEGEEEIRECVKVPTIDRKGEVLGIVGISRVVKRNKG